MSELDSPVWNEPMEMDGGGGGGGRGLGVMNPVTGNLVSEQPPTSYKGVVPVSAQTRVPLGTIVTSQPSVPPHNNIVSATNPVTDRSIFEAPISAVPTGDNVGTTSQQSGDNPGPVPAVGTQPPQTATPTVAASVPGTQSSSFGTLAIFAAIIIIVWMFAGAGLRRLL